MGELGAGRLELLLRPGGVEVVHGDGRPGLRRVRRDGGVALGGDGQVTLGQTVVKHGAKKIRRLYNDRVLAGFAGSAAAASRRKSGKPARSISVGRKPARVFPAPVSATSSVPRLSILTAA